MVVTEEMAPVALVAEPEGQVVGLVAELLPDL